MVVGLGTDLAEISRVARSIERFGERFLARVYTAGEISYCHTKKNAAESFAARFAAKEAAAKALGTGISYGVSWREFEVIRAPSGKPSMQLHGRAAELAARLGVTSIALSLTHSRDTAMAVVLLERAGD
jgi:holo-[acyl-carrier protein] synthase